MRCVCDIEPNIKTENTPGRLSLSFLICKFKLLCTVWWRSMSLFVSRGPNVTIVEILCLQIVPVKANLLLV